MKKPDKVKEFDYRLWITEDRKYMVKIKATGEECEVDTETFKLLRNEEKKLRRQANLKKSRPSELSLDLIVSDDESPYSKWLADSSVLEDKIEEQSVENELINTLSKRQYDVYLHCIKQSMSQREYADKNGLNRRYVSSVVTDIKNKIKKTLK